MQNNFEPASFINPFSRYGIMKWCLIVNRFTDCKYTVNLNFAFSGFETAKQANANFAVRSKYANRVPTSFSKKFPLKYLCSDEQLCRRHHMDDACVVNSIWRSQNVSIGPGEYDI